MQNRLLTPTEAVIQQPMMNSNPVIQHNTSTLPDFSLPKPLTPSSTMAISLYQTNLPTTQAYADNIYGNGYEANKAVDDDVNNTYFCSLFTHAKLTLDFTDFTNRYPIYIKGIALKSWAHFDTTIEYQIFGMEEGTNHFVPISNVESRFVQNWSQAPKYLPPVLIPYPASSKRYVAIEIHCRDLNSLSRIMIFDIQRLE